MISTLLMAGWVATVAALDAAEELRSGVQRNPDRL